MSLEMTHQISVSVIFCLFVRFWGKYNRSSFLLSISGKCPFSCYGNSVFFIHRTVPSSRIGQGYERHRKKSNFRHHTGICLNGLRKAMKTSIRIASFQALDMKIKGILQKLNMV